MYSLNKAGLLASTIVALLVITSCSDSGTSTTGVDPLSRDAAEAGAINNAALKREDHDHGPQGHEAVGIAAPGQGEGLGHQHAEPPEVVAGTVLTLATIPASSCGNFIPEAGEMCDDGPSGSATCTANCELKTGKGGEIVAENFCGDGKRRIIDGEQCDDGNADNTDSCTQYCRFAACGDGYTQPSNGEQCDDGNKNDSDSCNNSCQRPNNETTTTTDDGGSSSSTSSSSTEGSCDNPTWAFAGVTDPSSYTSNGATPPLWCAWLKNTQGITHQYWTGSNSWCLDGQWQSTLCGFEDPSSSSSSSSSYWSSSSSSSYWSSSSSSGRSIQPTGVDCGKQYEATMGPIDNTYYQCTTDCPEPGETEDGSVDYESPGHQCIMACDAVWQEAASPAWNALQDCYEIAR